jgi:hypothetical protein
LEKEAKTFFETFGLGLRRFQSPQFIKTLFAGGRGRANAHEE